MKLIKYRVLFVPSKDKDSDSAPLRCRVKWDGSRKIVSFNLGYRINPAKWSPITQRCLQGSYHGPEKTPANLINRDIERYRTVIDDVFAFYERMDADPSVDDLRSRLRVALGFDAPPSDTLLDALDRFVSEEGAARAWSRSIYNKFNALKYHLSAYNPALTFKDLTAAELSRYAIFLREKRNLRNSTINKHIQEFKWFLRWAASEGLLRDETCLSFAPNLKTTRNRVIFLTWDELMAVWDFRSGKDQEHLMPARDIFLFCCFTSLRYSDAVNLRWSDVTPTHINVTTLKTANTLRIDLNKYSEAILGIYVDEAFEDGRVFPKMLNQVMNRHIKEICRLCGINSPVRITYYKGAKRIDEVYEKWRLVTTHCGRRTFICNALMLGVAPNIVMKWTGHSDYNAMKPYIDITDTAKAEAMKVFDR